MNNNEWISVKDRLPEQKKEVLVSIKYGDIIQAYLGDNDNWFISRDVRDNAIECYANDPSIITRFQEITHWMPLPKPPSND